MKDFLKKIKASKKLINELQNADLKAKSSGNEVNIFISGENNMTPSSRFELQAKVSKMLQESNHKLKIIKFENKPKNDLIEIYENVKEYLSLFKPELNHSEFCIDITDEKLTIITYTKKVETSMKRHLESLIKFLSNYAITNLNIKITLSLEEQGRNKLEEIKIRETRDYEENKELSDNKIKKGHKLLDLNNKSFQRNIYFQGTLIGIERIKSRKTNMVFYKAIIGYNANAVSLTIFNRDNLPFNFKNGDLARIYGQFKLNDFSNEFEITMDIKNIQKISKEVFNDELIDKHEFKRNEFHVHTKMSVLDGASSVEDLIKKAEDFNLDSITITDHNSVQAFPDAYHASKKSKVKINYGLELDIYDDLNTNIVTNERDEDLLTAEYVFFDLETTSISSYFNEIIEFGGVKYKNNKIIDKKQLFVKPKSKISKNTTDLTSITDEDVANAPSIKEALVVIKKWIGNAVLVAHNSSFDLGFLNKALVENGFKKIKNPVIDSMKISWLIHPRSRGHRLGILAKHEKIKYDESTAHRADYDSKVLGEIFERLIQKLLKINIRTLKELNAKTKDLTNYIFTKHITIISKNQKGLKDINKIVSKASIDFFNSKRKIPTLPLSFIKKEKELFKNVLIGSSCSNGLLFQAILNNQLDTIDSFIGIYDYLEVFPPSAYWNWVYEGKLTGTQIEEVIKKIIEIGNEKNIPVIASSNAHYAKRSDKKFRDVLISAKRVGGGAHPLYIYKNPNLQKPDHHLRTTTEMFEEFSKFLSKEQAMKIIIDNPRKLQSMIKPQKPIHDKLYTPVIEGAEEKFKELVNKNIKKTYGDNVDKEIQARIDRELDSIINNGFSIIYYLSSISVKKSNDDGFLVGSRGSVGSSIVATLSDITEVNPLKPHYICDACKYHKFDDSADSGFDLVNKKCPKCGKDLRGEGHSIPFETFLGFNADKVPDIDLNFSRENQASVHEFIKNLLGKDKVFRAGTISTAALKTAKGYFLSMEEQAGRTPSKATVEWMAKNIEGAKRTTGQHPGGLIVVPEGMDIYDFTAINFPGDDIESNSKTTHFDFHSIHNNLLKLDFLGHLDPSSISMLQILTGVDPKKIPMNDPEVISLFKNNAALNYKENLTGEKLGIIGIPEFGTTFVRRLVSETKPNSFADLVRISGLSHGTNVWSENAQPLIKSKKATLSEVISVRDDILTYLINKGLKNSDAFNIMESVRKGKGLNSKWEELMIKNDVPSWYIDSCKKIEYMFPKAHATAYVIMAYRVAWYKINYPLEYYSTFFTKRDVEIFMPAISKGINEIKKHKRETEIIYKETRLKKDKDILETYNIILEMYSRGIEFTNILLNKSQVSEYIMDKKNNKIIPPMSSLDGIGVAVAQKFVEQRSIRLFESKQDLIKRSGIAKKIIEVLEQMNCLEKFKSSKIKTEQLSLFE